MPDGCESIGMVHLEKYANPNQAQLYRQQCYLNYFNKKNEPTARKLNAFFTYLRRRGNCGIYRSLPLGQKRVYPNKKSTQKILGRSL